MDVQKVIAWNVRGLRTTQGVSQEALAVDAGIDRTYVSRLERGMENPTVAVLARLAEALDVQIADLLKVPRQGAKPPAPLKSGRKRRT